MENEMKSLKLDRDKLKTVKTYAESEGITVQAVYKMIKEKRIKTDTIDGVVFIAI